MENEIVFDSISLIFVVGFYMGFFMDIALKYLFLDLFIENVHLIVHLILKVLFVSVDYFNFNFSLAKHLAMI